MAPVEEASRLAAGTVLSGPAGGMSGGRRCADLVGIPDLVPFDMGGTSTDISLISDGQASLSADGMLAGQRIALRSLDIASIAAGGGSIASVDAGGTLRVGPESAGSVPGPACYGNGGEAATVTDANVVLGYLDAAAFMGGKRPLDRAASEAAVDRIAASLESVARRGRRRHLPHDQSEDGRRHPPDDAAPRRRSPEIRAAEFRRRGGPACRRSRARTRDQAHHRADGGLGVVGLGHADQRSPLRSQPHALRRGARITADEVRELFAGLEQQAAGRLRSWFNGPMAIERSAEMRYGEQIFEIDVSLDGLDWNAADLVDRIEDRFHVRHEELYTYASRGQEVVFVNARVAAVGEVARRDEGARQAAASGACSPRGKRQAFFGGWREVPVYALDDLQPGHTLTGPAIIEAETTTVLVDTGDRVTVNALGWLDIELR